MSDVLCSTKRITLQRRSLQPQAFAFIWLVQVLNCRTIFSAKTPQLDFVGFILGFFLQSTGSGKTEQCTGILESLSLSSSLYVSLSAGTNNESKLRLRLYSFSIFINLPWNFQLPSGVCFVMQNNFLPGISKLILILQEHDDKIIFSFNPIFFTVS